MALSELLNIAKYSTGYHGDGAPAPATKSSQEPDNRQMIAMKLLQFKAQVDKAQADAAIAKRKQDIWNMVGTPKVGDKSTAGDVASIVDSEQVGGKDANIVNDGAVAMDATPKASIPADTQSDSSLVNMMKGLQPAISSQGDLILSRPKTPKAQDQTKVFGYAKRLADQAIIDSGKSRKDLNPQEYKTVIDSHLPQAQKFLYGGTDTTSNLSTQAQAILSRPAAAKTQGLAKHYDEARTFNYAKRLADQSIIQNGKRKRDISPEDYKTLVNDQIPQAEKALYGRALTQPEAAPAANADPTGIGQAVKVGMNAGLGNAPAPGETPNSPQVQAYSEGQTAINPKTGKRLQFKGGKWQALN